ncbi:hypothetical protein [Mucilaginibacter sp. dw_454]|uniref:hypothetical protein n=1 Tax=Mucilaginibacter sp. dw_454 TaxID=2720079 RepID=UPI001BD48EA7|nr:hypothetical protein [Mucilaginibacter sp. dw_454]
MDDSTKSEKPKGVIGPKVTRRKSKAKINSPDENLTPTPQIISSVNENGEIHNEVDSNSEIKQPPTQTMEVHHHPDLHHKKKHLREYFLEFLMIFLAVTLGFFAESLREHISEKSKEKEYMSALAAELKNDTLHYNVALKETLKLRPYLDSLFTAAHYPEQYNYLFSGKWNTPINEIVVAYTPELAIIQQLKTSGNLRLIGNKSIAEKTIQYETFVEGEYKQDVFYVYAAANNVFALEDQMCDETDFNKVVNRNLLADISNDSLGSTGTYDMRLIVKDPVMRNRLANAAVNYNARNWGYVTILNKAKNQATALLQLINDEYNLKNE